MVSYLHGKRGEQIEQVRAASTCASSSSSYSQWPLLDGLSRQCGWLVEPRAFFFCFSQEQQQDGRSSSALRDQTKCPSLYRCWPLRFFPLSRSSYLAIVTEGQKSGMIHMLSRAVECTCDYQHGGRRHLRK